MKYKIIKDKKKYIFYLCLCDKIIYIGKLGEVARIKNTLETLESMVIK